VTFCDTFRSPLQALPDGSSKYKVSVPDTITAVAEAAGNERMVNISFKFGALSKQSYVFQSSGERYRFLSMLWPMVPGYSPRRLPDNIAARLVSSSPRDSDQSTASATSPPPPALAAAAPADASSPLAHEGSCLHVFVGTWNHGQYPQDDAAAYDIKCWLLPEHVTQLSSRPQLYVIGCQESNSPAFSELLQQTLGSDYIQIASAALSLIPSSAIAIFAFVRKDVAVFVANVETCSVATGIGGLGGNKGATVVFLTYKHTSIAFVNCHLAAGVSHVRSRNRNAMDVLSRATVGRRGMSLEASCDYCFFFGDLNYRVETLYETAAAAVQSKQWQRLWSCDQLPPEQQSGRALHGFAEDALNFCPSYRWKTGVCELSNKNGQAASWCDRVLLHQHQDFGSRCLAYSSVPSIVTSDHRPVYALFRIESPVFDHSALAPPFRIELSKVLMLLLAASEPANVAGGEQPNAAPADAADGGDQPPLTPVLIKCPSGGSDSPARDSLRDSLRDSQLAAGLCTLGVRGNCIEGGTSCFAGWRLARVCNCARSISKFIMTFLRLQASRGLRPPLCSRPTVRVLPP
jgi:hypothetical protein